MLMVSIWGKQNSNTDIIKSHINYLESLQNRFFLHPNNEIAGNYIFNELKKYGYTPIKDSFSFGIHNSFNVISNSADLSKPVILLSAHFDSISIEDGKLTKLAPGADDNASGVAALLELARLLKNSKENIEFVFFNCEEVESEGSKHLASLYQSKNIKIKYMINIDTIGTWKGPISEQNPVNYVTDKNSELIVFQMKKHFPLPVKKAEELWRDDHGNFWDKGYIAIEITEDGCTEHMHKISDTSEKLNLDNISKIVDGITILIHKYDSK